MLWDLALLFTVLGGLYFLFIFVIRNKSLAKANRLNSKKKELAPIISNFLFHNEENSVPEKKDYVKLKIEIRDALKDASFRKVLTQILLDLQRDVSGETQKKLNELYCQLDLHHDAYKKLKSWQWQVVSQGILELTQMQVVDSFAFITKFINDRRGIIRKQAEIATVSLKPEGINYFMDTTRYSISEWQQLKLMEVLRGIEHFRPPAFKTWFISGNPDVVLFALRLIRHYNQNDAATSIIELVKHKNERIKMAAIQCIKEFCLINALDTLKAVFSKTGQAVQIEILDTLATLGNEEELEFFKKVEEQSSVSFLVKNKAQMAINEIMPETFIPTKDILDPSELDTSLIVEDHFDDTQIEEAIQKIAASEKDETAEEPMEETIAEIEEIEVFEVDPEIVSTGREKEVDEDTTQQSKKIEPTFEIGPISSELDTSINDQIGLIATVEDEESHQKNEDMPEAGTYFNMNHDEKIEFIKLLEASATEKDIPLLEELMQRELDSELRYSLFKTLKSIKSDANDSVPETVQNQAIESIFYSLMEYASDLDSKLILLKEISEVGDEKELPLLEVLENDVNTAVKNQAKKTKEILLERLNIEQIENETENDTGDGSIQEFVDAVPDPNESRLPLELCFLEDYGIEGCEEKDSDIAFELTEEFYQEQKARTSTEK